MPKDYTKTHPRVISSDIIKYIANNSSLTKPQVRECFQVYNEVLKQIATSQNIDSDLTISLPYIGNFYFAIRKGRKKGQSYHIPIKYGAKELKTVVLEEDELDSYRLALKVSPKLNRDVKDIMNERLKP